MICIYLQNINEILNSVKNFNLKTEKKTRLPRILVAGTRCTSKLHKLLALNTSSITFDTIYRSFVPRWDYDFNCLKIK